MSENTTDLSLVIPLFNEAESIPELKRWIDDVLRERSYEVIFIDDGSRDDSWQVIQELAEKDPSARRGFEARPKLREECRIAGGLRSCKRQGCDNNGC